MAETTQIPPDKVRVLLATNYRLGHTEYDIILNIGERAARLADLFTSSGVTCGAFLTAYNPRGAIQSDEANGRGHAELAAMLRDQALRSIEGSGSDEGTEWPAEKSYFALGLQLHAAKQIGGRFDQNAIFRVGLDAVRKLIPLR
ncbi:DUF3293 domain-containing protein [Shewanella sp.]|uniref:DUF3293 domain-containing protein n=1 Tax=Shewanella sp. TaxID=50422 RepID=UPI004048E374